MVQALNVTKGCVKVNVTLREDVLRDATFSPDHGYKILLEAFWDVHLEWTRDDAQPIVSKNFPATMWSIGKGISSTKPFVEQVGRHFEEESVNVESVQVLQMHVQDGRRSFSKALFRQCIRITRI